MLKEGAQGCRSDHEPGQPSHLPGLTHTGMDSLKVACLAATPTPKTTLSHVLGTGPGSPTEAFTSRLTSRTPLKTRLPSSSCTLDIQFIVFFLLSA